MKTLKFKLYNHKRNRHLKRTINVAGIIYNHCIALHKRYYRMFKKHLSCAKLQAHIAKLRNRKPLWQQVGSQAVQDICQEIEGRIKTVTIKRTPLGELLLVVVTDYVDEPASKFETGRTAGFDFGLKTFDGGIGSGSWPTG